MNETGYQATEPADREAVGDGSPDPVETVGAEETTPTLLTRWRRALPRAGKAVPAGEASGGDIGADAADEGAAVADGGGATFLGRWRWALPWVLLVLAVAVAATSTWQWRQLAPLEAQEQEREEVAQSAGTFMLALTNWDATEGMGEVREDLRTHGTQRFAGEVDELFGTTEDLRELAEVGARSEGEVRRFFVQELEDDRAVALVVLVQRLVTDVTEGEEVSVRYAELDLLQRDSEWLVDEVELLVDVAQQEAEPIVPGAEDAQEAP